MTKYTIDHSSFDPLSRESSWVLGWIATDGYVDEKNLCVRFEIQERDREVLERIKLAMKSNHPINERRNGASVELRMNSMKMVNDLLKVGIKQNKSLTLEFPIMSDEYKPHFIRGVFEGDGSVWFDTGSRDGIKHLRTSFTSASEEFIKGISDTLTSLGIEKASYQKVQLYDNRHQKYVIRLCKIDSLQLYNVMYENCGNWYMPRKRDKFNEIIDYESKKSRLVR